VVTVCALLRQIGCAQSTDVGAERIGRVDYLVQHADRAKDLGDAAKVHSGVAGLDLA
jgi:hypothetical protein